MEPTEKKGRALKPEELVEKREGDALYEMVHTAGWKIVERMLKKAAFHVWSDPREAKSMNEWNYMEICTFFHANAAKELLNTIEEMVGKADYLGKVEAGIAQQEQEAQKMRI